MLVGLLAAVWYMSMFAWDKYPYDLPAEDSIRHPVFITGDPDGCYSGYWSSSYDGNQERIKIIWYLKKADGIRLVG